MRIIIAVLFGIMLGIGVPVNAEPDSDDYWTAPQLGRVCKDRTDTMCVVRSHIPGMGPLKVKFIANGMFCVRYRVHPPIHNRCEEYWPFKNPVINADLK